MTLDFRDDGRSWPRLASGNGAQHRHGTCWCGILRVSTTRTSPVVRLALALGLGLIAGAILGVMQWTVFRHLVTRAGRWLWANALAWGISMPLIFVGIDIVPWTGRRVVLVLSVYAVCSVAGLVAGAIHGRVLVQLVTTAASPSAPKGD
jgi:hypothetical protein